MNVKSQYYPASDGAHSDIPLVLLHGWAADTNCWQARLPELNKHRHVIAIDLPNFGGSQILESERLDDWLEVLLPALPERGVFIGWSLGGMLALQVAARHPERVTALVTIASNLKFVHGDGWRSAMPAKIERGFYQGFVESPERTLKTFAALEAQGELDERASLKKLRALQKITAQINEGWGSALQLLATIDNRRIYSELMQPGLHLLAEGDALVPASAAEAMRSMNTGQQVELLMACGHAPHISQPQKVLSPLKQFLDALL